MRIATYNVHGWCDATGRKRIDDVVALLGGLDCDVIVLNEVLWFDSVLPRVAAALDMATTFAPAGFGGNAILARVPIREGASVDLHDRRFQTRSAAIARVTLGALAIDIVGLHLEHTNEDARLSQLRQLHAVLAARAVPHLLAGDFNAMRLSDLASADLALLQHDRQRRGWEAARDDVVRFLDERGYVDAVRLATLGEGASQEVMGGPSGLLLEAYRASLATPIHAAHAVTSRVGTRIDHLYLSAPLVDAVHVSGARTVPSDASDHSLVLIDIAAR